MRLAWQTFVPTVRAAHVQTFQEVAAWMTYAATVRNWFMALNHLSYVVGIDAEVHQAISSQAYELLRSG